jgi:hypothetical protein
MASAIYTANSTSQLTTVATTDKVRIATSTSAIAIAVGNSSVTANLTACEIIPANTVDNSFTVGQGNYIAYINVAGTAGAFSITDLGAVHANTGTE